MYRLLPFLLCLCLTVACSRRPDPALVRASEMASDSPRVALAILDSVDYSRLGAADRHFHDFLTVKARDKAYITHTSDSLILDVISYYEGKPLYAEALYYGGRVYSDMGDFPTALEYFQRGLDEIEANDPESLHVKGNLLSQTGRLLNELRLFSQAIPYMKDVLVLDSIEGDAYNLAYDNMLLGAICFHQKNYKDAGRQFDKAMAWTKSLTSADVGQMLIYQAGLRQKLGDIDSALTLIRGVPDMVAPIARNQALIYASDIYLDAGIKDTAYIYADELIHSRDSNNRDNGYRILFTTDLYDMIPADSLHAYTIKYTQEMQNYYNSHEAQQALIQNVFYNYQVHLKERAKAENNSRRLTYIALLTALIALCLGIVLIWFKYRKNVVISSLQKAILDLEGLRNDIPQEQGVCRRFSPNPSLSDEANLRNRLLHQIKLLKEQDSEKRQTPDVILSPDLYKRIGQYLGKERAIPESSPVWGQLETEITTRNPSFKENLRQMTGQNLKSHDYQMVLLVKCGFTPTEIAILQGRSKSTISYRRKRMCELILGENMDGANIDDVIKYL